MDYVKETLQRQSAAWLALFGGSRMASPETVEEGGESSSARQTETGERSAERAAGSVFTVTAQEATERLTRDEMVKRSAWDAWTETPVQERQLRDRERLTQLVKRAATAWENTGADKAAKAVEGESLAPESARWEAEAALREGRSDLETADARAISRRFERDARRYDGGFIFY